MGKVFDITDKLTFDTNPKLKIKDEEIEVRGDAVSVLQIMNMAQTMGNDEKAMMEMEKILFPEESREKIKKLNLRFDDWLTVVQEAVTLAIGDTESRGR